MKKDKMLILWNGDILTYDCETKTLSRVPIKEPATNNPAEIVERYKHQLQNVQFDSAWVPKPPTSMRMSLMIAAIEEIKIAAQYNEQWTLGDFLPAFEYVAK